jgi:hypothetical protein
MNPIKLIACLLVAATANAQVQSIAGPQQAGLGHQVVVTISNDDTIDAWIDGQYTVTDQLGNVVYTNPAWGSSVSPGTVYFAPWNQVDDFGNPVREGTYRIDVDVPDPWTGLVSIESHTVVVSGKNPSIAPRGVPRIGLARGYQLTATQFPLKQYVMLASLSTTVGIGTCAGTLPLDADPLFMMSLTAPGSTFAGFTGTLDIFGKSISPTLSLPNDPTLVGLPYHLAFVTLDPTSPCPFSSISSVESLVIG